MAHTTLRMCHFEEFEVAVLQIGTVHFWPASPGHRPSLLRCRKTVCMSLYTCTTLQTENQTISFENRVATACIAGAMMGVQSISRPLPTHLVIIQHHKHTPLEILTEYSYHSTAKIALI